MLKYALIATLLICLSSTAHAAPFTCKVTGDPTRSSYRISKGKIGNYNAKIVGQDIVVNTQFGKYIVKPSGKTYLNGTSQGKMQCNPTKARQVIIDG